MKSWPEHYKRIVIKTGSSLLFDESGELRHTWMDSLAADIAALHKENIDIIWVCSGAVALGRPMLGGAKADLQQPNRKQAAAACGQPLLIHAIGQSLSPYQLKSAQILLTLNDTESRQAYLNVRNTLNALERERIIAIINENDSVTTHGILYGDNDRLAARIAAMSDADALILLSDVDGLYDANPNYNPTAQLIEEVLQITDSIKVMANGKGSAIASGGMQTKIEAAEIATRAGCDCLIGNGKHHHPLARLLENTHTRFVASNQKQKARKRWISGSIQPAAEVMIDGGAVNALLQGNSLLHIGVTKITGEFRQGDTLQVTDNKGKCIAKGLASIDSDMAKLLIGKRSSEIEEILGFSAQSELIHRDHLVMN